MFTADYWRDTLERAIKTGAQFAVTAAGTTALGIFDLDWRATAAAFALGSLLSVLTSLASEPFGEPDSPSLITPTAEEWVDDDPTYLRHTGNPVTARDPVQDVTQDPATDYGD